MDTGEERSNRRYQVRHWWRGDFQSHPGEEEVASFPTLEEAEKLYLQLVERNRKSMEVTLELCAHNDPGAVTSFNGLTFKRRDT